MELERGVATFGTRMPWLGMDQTQWWVLVRLGSIGWISLIGFGISYFRFLGFQLDFEYRGFDIKIGLGFGVWVFLGLMPGIGLFQGSGGDGVQVLGFWMYNKNGTHGMSDNTYTFVRTRKPVIWFIMESMSYYIL